MRRFTSMRVDEVSTVDKGAGEGTRIVFFKRQSNEGTTEMSAPAILEIAKRMVAAHESGTGGAVSVLKSMGAGDYVPPDTRSHFLDAMQKGAAEIQRPGESDFQAFKRYTASGDGHIILKAERMLARAEQHPSRESIYAERAEIVKGRDDAYAGLTAKAADLRKAHPELSEAQAFAKVALDPSNAAAVRASLNQSLDPGPQRVTPAPGSEGGAPPPVTPSLQKLNDMAIQFRNDHPESSYSKEQAFARVLQTPAGKALYRSHLAEQARGETADEATE